MRLFRRDFLALSSTAILSACAPAIPKGSVEIRAWQTYFPDLNKASILVDTTERRLAFWGKDDSDFREFPVGIARADELLRLGKTEIVRKRIGPDWRPTPSMLKINPDLPKYVPAGPGNPLGTHALYLGWQYYAIHGTNDDYTIGRRSTSGCFRLFSGHIKWLYENAPIGTRVLVI